ncbi:hypothetical protein KQI65_05250 [bacterium]|nr:hypothetical protein [bacterium]
MKLSGICILGITFILLCCLQACSDDSSVDPASHRPTEFTPPTLTFPADEGVIYDPLRLAWESGYEYDSYRLQISEDAGFQSMVFNQDVGTFLEVIPPKFLGDREYFWRVAGQSPDTAVFSDVQSFTFFVLKGPLVQRTCVLTVHGVYLQFIDEGTMHPDSVRPYYRPYRLDSAAIERYGTAGHHFLGYGQDTAPIFDIDSAGPHKWTLDLQFAEASDVISTLKFKEIASCGGWMPNMTGIWSEWYSFELSWQGPWMRSGTGGYYEIRGPAAVEGFFEDMKLQGYRTSSPLGPSTSNTTWYHATGNVAAKEDAYIRLEFI